MSAKKQMSIFSFFSKNDGGDTAKSPSTGADRAMKPKQDCSSAGRVSKKLSLADKKENGGQSEEGKPPYSSKRSLEILDEDSPVKTTRSAKRSRVVISSDSEDSDGGQLQDGGRGNGHKKKGKEEEPMEVEVTSGNEREIVPDSQIVDDEEPTDISGMKTPKTSKKAMATPKSLFARTPKSSQKPTTPSSFSTPRASNRNGGMAESFIDSFRAKLDEDNTSMLSTDSTPKRSVCKGNIAGDDGGGGGPVTSADTPTASSVLVDDCSMGRFPHLEFDFLRPEKIRDAEGRSSSHPDYCPRTLFVPEAFLKKQTPGHRQWWAAKSAFFDTVLFFKVGKFYEMYHMDAVIGVENLNLTYMRGNYAHCGFPEIAYGRFADQLISRGYKVARVEQTETPAQLEERNKNVKTSEKVVRREVCQVTTAGTRTYGVLDGCDERSALSSVEANSRFLLAFAEKLGASKPIYGVCFVDTSVGRFFVGQFDDDSSRSSFRTLLAHYQPAQILFERGRISPGSQSVLQNVASAVQKEALLPKKEFPTAEATVKMLAKEIYLGDAKYMWPEAVRSLLSDSSIVPTCAPNFEECVSALGAVIMYLKRCLIDVDMVTMRKFERYIPPLQSQSGFKEKGVTGVDRWRDRLLVVDGISLYNLNIVPPLGASRRSVLRDTTSSKYSLYNTINKCITPFGKRQLRQWVCAPSCDPNVLVARQDAVEWLLRPDAGEFLGRATEFLRKLPDLERLLQKIHVLGLKYRACSHPDGRAVMFETSKYNRRKIKDLLSALDGFEQILCLVKTFHQFVGIANDDFDSTALPSLLNRCFGEQFPQIAPDLAHFRNAFDQGKARETGVIVPERGVDAEYDAAKTAISMCIRELNNYLKEIRDRLRCREIKFIESGKSRYHLEIPDSVAKNLSNEFELKSSRKGYRRMTNAEGEELINKLVEAEMHCEEIGRDVTRRVFEDFDSRAVRWAAVTERVAVFDVLLSLARYAQSCGLEMCRPEFVFDADKPLLEIVSGYHPCLAAMMFGSAETQNQGGYIPNSVNMGGSEPLTMLLTGPNMGGKSTLMRQVAVLVLLAQIGSLVPAKKMRLSPVDRIFTRIGARDRLTAGHSTFYVELNETNIILRNATVDSLIVMDELGRGTSTHDGTAIAYAVLKTIAEKLNCRAFFSTHYHSLCGSVQTVKSIKISHMACIVDNENDDDPTLENVTFLYTLADGVCPKSYGFFAAKVSGIKKEVIRKGFAASQTLDSTNNFSRRLIAIREAAEQGDDIGELQQMIAAM